MQNNEEQQEETCKRILFKDRRCTLLGRLLKIEGQLVHFETMTGVCYIPLDDVERILETSIPFESQQKDEDSEEVDSQGGF